MLSPRAASRRRPASNDLGSCRRLCLRECRENTRGARVRPMSAVFVVLLGLKEYPAQGAIFAFGETAVAPSVFRLAHSVGYVCSVVPAWIAWVSGAPSREIALLAVPAPPLRVDFPRNFLLFRTARVFPSLLWFIAFVTSARVKSWTRRFPKSRTMRPLMRPMSVPSGDAFSGWPLSPSTRLAFLASAYRSHSSLTAVAGRLLSILFGRIFTLRDLAEPYPRFPARCCRRPYPPAD